MEYGEKNIVIANGYELICKVLSHQKCLFSRNARKIIKALKTSYKTLKLIIVIINRV